MQARVAQLSLGFILLGLFNTPCIAKQENTLVAVLWILSHPINFCCSRSTCRSEVGIKVDNYGFPSLPQIRKKLLAPIDESDLKIWCWLTLKTTTVAGTAAAGTAVATHVRSGNWAGI